MNEKLQVALSELINQSLKIADKATSTAGKATDFMAEEIPETVHQLIMWHGISSFIWFIIGCMLIYIVLWYPYSLLTNRDNIDWNNKKFTPEIGKGIFKIGASVISLFIAPFFINFQWLQIWIAPKVWLIEYASKLIKK